MMAPKIGGVLPERVVVPENVNALLIRVDDALLTKFPLRLIELL